MAISEADCPYTGPYSIEGNGLHEGPTAEALKRAMKRAQFGFKNKDLGELNQVYNQDLEGSLDRWDPGGQNGYAEGRWNKIRSLKCPPESPHQGEWALDEYALNIIRDEHMRSQVPDLGPVFSGGLSVLKQDLTHATSGLPTNSSGRSMWPAFDDAYSEGKTIIAPEQIEVYQASSSNPGDACYAKGKSGLRYWFGHLVTAPGVGAVINKGKTIGKVCHNEIGGGPHVHVAVNVENLWGTGKSMTHRVDYSHGAPKIGDQLAAGHPL